MEESYPAPHAVTLADLDANIASRKVSERELYDTITSVIHGRPFGVREMIEFERARSAYPSALPPDVRAHYVSNVACADLGLTAWCVPLAFAAFSRADGARALDQGSQKA